MLRLFYYKNVGEYNMDLKELIELYDKNLNHKVFNYKLEDGKEINLIFKPGNFTHLIGLEYFAPDPKVKYKYRANKGYNNIKNGYLNIKQLKSNKNTYKIYKAKLENINKLYDILCNQKFVYFKNDIVPGNCKINAQYLIYKEYYNKDIHLGINKNLDSNIFFPRSFFLAQKKQKGMYIKDQKKIQVIEFKISTLDKFLTEQEVAADKQKNIEIYENMKLTGQALGYLQVSKEQLEYIKEKGFKIAYFKSKSPGKFNIAFNEKSMRNIMKTITMNRNEKTR